MEFILSSNRTRELALLYTVADLENGPERPMPDHPGAPVANPGLRDLEAMWKALLALDWTSLAVIPTDHGVSVQHVVDALGATSAGSKPSVRCVDARGVDVAEASRLERDLATSLSEGSRAVIVVDPLTRSLSGVHLVQGVSAILLVVWVGAMDLDSLNSTVSIVGVERILGSVTAPVEP